MTEPLSYSPLPYLLEELKEVRRPSILLRDLKILLSWYFGRRFLSRLSPRTMEILGRAAVMTGLPLLKGEMEFFRKELEFILGRDVSDEEIREISIRTFTGLLCQDYEIFHYRRFDRGNIGRFVRIEGLCNLEMGLKEGKGVLLLISHFGSNQLIMPAVGFMGYRMNQLSSPPREWWKRVGVERATPIYRWMSEERWRYEEGLPVRHINIFRFLRPAYEALKNNEIVAIAVDGGGGERFVEVDFLARRASISPGSIFLGVKTDAVMLPTFIIKEKGSHRMVIEPRLERHPGRETEREVEDLARLFMKRLEEYVRGYPCHYLYFLLMRWRVRKYDRVPFLKGAAHWDGE